MAQHGQPLQGGDHHQASWELTDKFTAPGQCHKGKIEEEELVLTPHFNILAKQFGGSELCLWYGRMAIPNTSDK